MNKKEAYEKRLEAQLDEWRADIAKMKAQAAKADAKIQVEYNKRIEELQSMQQMAAKKLAELKIAGDDAWEDLQEGIEGAWNSFSDAIKSATSRFMNKP
jgi:chromosome segregation ATPase